MATTAARRDRLPSSANDYPVGAIRPMASLKHDRARQTALALLIALLAPAHLVASELLVMYDPEDGRAPDAGHPDRAGRGAGRPGVAAPRPEGPM